MSRVQLKCPCLCLVTDPERPDLIQCVEQALAAGVTMLQLRGHALSSARLYSLAIELRALCQKYQALFIVNDRVDVGLAVGADGFQLGIHSLPLAVVRQLIGERPLLGASVHTPEEAEVAVADGADFLLIGTIFASPSHPGRTPDGPQLVGELKRMGLAIPLLAIGGITSENAGYVIEAGADGVAVLSAIFDVKERARSVQALRSALGLNRRQGENING